MSTDHSRFPSHGKAHFVMRDQIVRLYVEGLWNKELVTEIHEQLLTAVRGHYDRPWAVMVILTDSAICGVDAMAEIRKVATEELKVGRSATAWVVHPDVEGSSWVSDLLRTLYEGINSANVFETEHEAEVWLRAKLEGQP